MGRTSLDGAGGGELTPRQRRIVEFIKHCVRSNGYAPTVREIAMASGLASVSSVSLQLGQLEELGVLVCAPGRPRTTRPYQEPTEEDARDQGGEEPA